MSSYFPEPMSSWVPTCLSVRRSVFPSVGLVGLIWSRFFWTKSAGLSVCLSVGGLVSAAIFPNQYQVGCPLVCPSVRLFVCLSVCWRSATSQGQNQVECPFVLLSICLWRPALFPSQYQVGCCLSVCLSVCLSCGADLVQIFLDQIGLSVRPSVCLSVCGLDICSLPQQNSSRVPLCLSVCLSVFLCVCGFCRSGCLSQYLPTQPTPVHTTNTNDTITTVLPASARYVWWCHLPSEMAEASSTVARNRFPDLLPDLALFLHARRPAASLCALAGAGGLHGCSRS